MSRVPDTRESLIVRLPNGQDAEAWREFAAIYEPFVRRFALRRGLQDADARELSQEVFMGVAKAVSRWEANASRARFRTWLFRIAKNQLLTLVKRKQRERVLDSAEWEGAALEAVDAGGGASEEELEYRREVFRWASRQVERDVNAQTWRAFWMTSVEGREVDEVASTLNVSRGTVYVARSRVIARLRAAIQRFESEVD